VGILEFVRFAAVFGMTMPMVEWEAPSCVLEPAWYADGVGVVIAEYPPP
jgi:hypothetical protein